MAPLPPLLGMPDVTNENNSNNNNRLTAGGSANGGKDCHCKITNFPGTKKIIACASKYVSIKA